MGSLAHLGNRGHDARVLTRRAALSFGATIILCATSHASLGADGGATPASRTVAPGAEQLDMAALDAVVFRFDLERYAVDVLAPGPDHRLTASEARRRQGALLVVNGGFFDERWRSLGLRVAGGAHVVPLRRAADWGVLVVRGRRASIVHTRAFDGLAGVQAAVQVGPRVLIAGAVPSLKPQTARRTGVCVSGDGRFVTVLATRRAVLASDVGQAMHALGCHDGLMLDGGPSTQLAAGPVGQTAAARGDTTDAFPVIEIAGAYAVPDLLLVRRR